MPLIVRRFITPADARALLHHLGRLLQLLAVLLLPPLLVAVLTLDRTRIAAFVGMAAGSWLLGRLAAAGEPRELRRREALLATALVYPLYATVASVAFVGHMPPVDALFEAMSGLTTTGLTLIDVEAAPASLLFYRAWLQFVAGAGIIIISLVVLTQAGSAAAQLYASEAIEQNLLGSVRATARMVAFVYLALTAAGYLALLLAGADPFSGLLHAFAMVSTAGFSPFGESIAAYGSLPITAVTAFFMLAGAVSLPIYWLAWRGRIHHGWRRVLGDVQVRTLLVLAVVGAVLFAAYGPTQGHSQGAAGVAFNAISAVTTTGFTVGDPAAWPTGTRITAMALMVIGGGLGSTAGGIKLLRLLMLAALVRWMVYRLMLPREAHIRVHVGGRSLDREDAPRAAIIVTLYMLVLLASMLALAPLGNGMADPLFDTISALSTVGLSVGFVDPGLPGWAKLLLAFDMWVGRVEFIPVLLLLYRGNWQRSGGRKQR